MHILNWLLPFIILPALSKSTAHTRRDYDSHTYYVLEYTQSVEGSPLDEIVRTFGVEIVEQVGALRDHWLVRRKKALREVDKRAEEHEDPVLAQYRDIILLEKTGVHSRSESRVAKLSNSVKSISLQTPRQRVKRAPPPIPPPGALSNLTAQRLGIEDPLFPEQWHLVNDEFPEHMMNVTGVWEMGYKGKGVISTLIDDGLDYTSQDLADNFDAANSHDYNDHVSLPTPKLFDDTHGTRCAGQIAAVKNGVCGIGIAYESKVAGVRILSGPISDADEAIALNYGYQNVSLYSCSWGPPDDGRTMEGPDRLIRQAMLEGVNNGRGGKGSVFVFASGNGAASGDQCNFDGYTNSIWSVTVSAVDYKGLHPYYSESCAANMIVAYSSGNGKNIVTTDRGKEKCTSSHGGTSAAAPNAVGVFALALQARPDLTWRDIQHLCVETARQDFLSGAEWETTAINRQYSYKYGYGALDGYRFVRAALDWQLVKPQSWLQTPTVQLGGGKMTEDKVYTGGEFITADGVTSKITITEDDLLRHNLEKLEHVNVKVWIQHAKRGEVEVEVVSPNGIKSILANARQGDWAETGFPGWTFMSVKHWGEDPVGTWTIRVWDAKNSEKNGTFLGWNMLLWGSSIDPSKASKYELPMDDAVFPPQDNPPPPLPSASVTRVYTKPTSFLNDMPVSGGPTSQGSSWLQGVGGLVAHQKWFFAALGFIALVGIGVAFVLWRRQIQRRNDNYASLGRSVPMSSLNSAQGGYEEPADGEGTAEEPLLNRRYSDDQHYRDEPDQSSHIEEPSSGSDGSSGDGSWVHASG
ncbi:pheromone processing endoprotease [Marasmius crinis-equi]|uniref:Pheromone processing endoprotease n=1 Tax=Marasmius crinis-equi TaxID=585013 RepID=A0ABR3FZV9_9AGAR